MVVTAEGVETVEQAEAARNAGCDRIQGHLIARAMPPDDLVRWLRAADLDPVTAMGALSEPSVRPAVDGPPVPRTAPTMSPVSPTATPVAPSAPRWRLATRDAVTRAF